MNQTASSSAARALFEAHAPSSSLFHVGRGLFGMHLDIVARGAWALGRPPASSATPVPAKRAATVDARNIAKHLGHALGICVNEVDLISLSDPYADVSWLTEEMMTMSNEAGFAGTLDDCIDDDFAGTYWGRLRLGMEPKLLRRLKEEYLERLESDVAALFSHGIDAALRATIGGKVSDRRMDLIRNGVEDTLVFFAGLAAIDDRPSGVPLGHLVRVLTSALPLGMKKGEPGTWLFLVA